MPASRQLTLYEYSPAKAEGPSQERETELGETPDKVGGVVSAAGCSLGVAVIVTAAPYSFGVRSVLAVRAWTLRDTEPVVTTVYDGIERLVSSISPEDAEEQPVQTTL